LFLPNVKIDIIARKTAFFTRRIWTNSPSLTNHLWIMAWFF